jgi:hypothetical protein
VVHGRELPPHALKVADRPAEGHALACVAQRLVECALGEPERDRRIEAALGVECRQQLLEAAFAQQQVLRRQFAVLEPHLLQILAAHGVESAGEDEARRAFLDQDAADAVATRLTVDAREHDEGARFLGAADQRLHALEAQRVAVHGRVGGVARDVGSGLRLGHADGENAVARANRGQQSPLDRLRPVGRDDAGLDADFSQHRHGRDVAALGDFLEHQRGVEDAELRAAIGLRHGHAEHADFRKAGDGTRRSCIAGRAA